MEWGDSGVRVNCIAPGAIEDTEGFRRLGKYELLLPYILLLIMHFSIYQSNRYPFLRALIGSHNSRYPRLLVDFEMEVKIAGSTRGKNKIKVHIVLLL